MSLIADIASGRTKSNFPGMNSGREVWNRVFGNTDRRVLTQPDQHRVRADGGSYGRSVLGEPAAYKRLLIAMRSMAPGGWSDNRWEQAKQLVGITWIAIHRICCQWQQSDFQVFERDLNSPNGKKAVSPDHPLVKLLERPNRQDSFGQHMYRLGQQKYLTGTALEWEVPNYYGTPCELYCVPTAIAIPQPAINPDYPDGYYRIQPVYPYGPFSSYPTPATSVGAPIPAQWMIRHQFPHPLLRYDGYSPLTGMRLQLDELNAMDRSRWYSMQRVFAPEAVLNFDETEGAVPLPWEEIERIHAEMMNEFQSPENAGRLYVGTPGAKLEKWGTVPREMDYPQSWEQLVSFCLSGLGINKPAAGMVDDASYANLWASLKQLHLLTLKPDLDAIAADLTKHLAPFFGDNLIIEIRCPRIDDHDQKMAKLDKLIQGRAIKKKELRQELEMPVTGEAWEEEFAGEGQEQEVGGKGGELTLGKEEEKLPTKFPDAGTLGDGALGPRKHLVKSFYDQVRDVIGGNGNGRHK